MSETEISDFIMSVSKDQIPDYQVAAWLMAVRLKGISKENRTHLTLAMRDSGRKLDLKSLKKPKVDKHSTGGVGDKTSFLCMAMASAAGVCVPSLAGRTLGHTGGTIDKLESIPGLKTTIEDRVFKNQLEGIGWVISAQSDDICPADKRLYGLRDVTATIDSIDLITASILSKKLAEDIDGLVMDVKFGNGAFMTNLEDAKVLGRSIAEVALLAGVKTATVYSSMNQPLGRWSGNRSEVIESIEILDHDMKPFYQETLDLSVTLAAHMIFLSGIAKSAVEAEQMAKDTYKSKRALDQFVSLIEWQGGKFDQFKFSPQKQAICSSKKGYIKSFNTRALGELLILLGGGRTKKTDVIDPTASLEFCKKIGDSVDPNDPVIFAHNDKTDILTKVLSSFTEGHFFEISEEKVASEQLIQAVELTV